MGFLTMIWRMLPNILAILATMLIALLDYKWFDKRTNKFRMTLKALLIVLVVLMVVNIISVCKEDAEKAALLTQINELKGMQFGGSSYCYVFPTRPNKTSQSLELMLLHEGEYPVFDVSVRVEDVNRLVEILRRAQQKGDLPYDSKARADAAIRPAVGTFTIGNVGPKQVVNLPTLRMSGQDEESYNIYIMARNGAVFEQLRLCCLSGDWKLAYRVFRNNNLMREYADPDFPWKDSAAPWNE